MCEFVSWIEYQDKIYYLDDNKLNTKEGRKLLKYLGDFYADLHGHGSIRFFYPELGSKGKDKECTDFSTPDNFPPEIVEAIKKGLFVNFGACPQILTPSALDLFINSKTGIVYAEWKKADAERKKAEAEEEKTYAEWKKVDAEWEKAYDEWVKAYVESEKADAEWKKAKSEKAYVESEKAYAKREKAYAEWKKVEAEWRKAYAKWEKADKTFFWQLARVKKNRIKAWQ